MATRKQPESNGNQSRSNDLRPGQGKPQAGPEARSKAKSANPQAEALKAHRFQKKLPTAAGVAAKRQPRAGKAKGTVNDWVQGNRENLV